MRISIVSVGWEKAGSGRASRLAQKTITKIIAVKACVLICAGNMERCV
jgi:hypothetical protein